MDMWLNATERINIMILRESLYNFAVLQEEILRDNDHKEGWGHCPNNTLLEFLKRELEELEEALINSDKDDIRKECADIANYAMMIASNNESKIPMIHETQNWQDIDSAPKDGTRILLGFKGMQDFDVIAHYENGAWRLAGKTRLHGRPDPTHWLPLPKAPGR